MNKKRGIKLIVFLVILLIVVNYFWLDKFFIKFFENINREDFTVKRIVDGDTIVVGENLTVRLFGINTPEKGEKYYSEAKNFTSQIWNKTIFLESFGKDMYGRTLGVVFFNDENFNAQIIQNGFANVYILDNKKYENDFRKSWDECVSLNKNLCEKSEDKCAKCISVNVNIDTQTVILQNICSSICDLTNWSIKDEGRKKFIFPVTKLGSNEEMKITEKNFDEEYVWTKTGDTIFLRDDEGKLVFWKRIN